MLLNLLHTKHALYTRLRILIILFTNYIHLVELLQLLLHRNTFAYDVVLRSTIFALTYTGLAISFVTMLPFIFGKYFASQVFFLKASV